MSPQEKQLLESLKQQVESLQSEIRLNNFTGHQDFNKYCNFTSALKVPSYSTAPTTAEIGEIIEVAGKLYICSSADTFSLVGTQT